VVNPDGSAIEGLEEFMLEGYTKLPAHFNDNRIDIECELKIDSLQSVKGTYRLDLGCGSSIILTNEGRKGIDLTGKRQAKCYYSNMEKEKPESIRQQRQLLPDHKRSNPDEEDLSG